MSTATVQEPLPPPANLSLDDDEHYEIIDGERVSLPPMSIRATWIASQLMQHLGNFGRTHNLGQTVGEGLFRLPLPIDRNRRPDVTFVATVSDAGFLASVRYCATLYAARVWRSPFFSALWATLP